MTFATTDGVLGPRPVEFLVSLAFSRSDSCAGVSVIISVSMADSPVLEPICSGEIAPVSLPLHATLCVTILSKALLRHESIEIGRRFLGMDRSVHPGFGLSTHVAFFYAGGKTESWRCPLKRSVRMLGSDVMVLSIMVYETLSSPVTYCRLQFCIAFNISCTVMGLSASPRFI